MSNHVFDVTTENFEQVVLHAAQPVLVDFTADWCPPCKMLAPIVEELAAKYQTQLRVGSVDSDRHIDLTEQFGVLGLPTLILFKNGKPVEQVVGFMPRHKLEARLTPHFERVEITSTP